MGTSRPGLGSRSETREQLAARNALAKKSVDQEVHAALQSRSKPTKQYSAALASERSGRDLAARSRSMDSRVEPVSSRDDAALRKVGTQYENSQANHHRVVLGSQYYGGTTTRKQFDAAQADSRVTNAKQHVADTDEQMEEYKAHAASAAQIGLRPMSYGNFVKSRKKEK